MELMLVAARAVLLPLDALGMQALVLRGEVVAILTLATGENDLVSRHNARPGKKGRVKREVKIESPELGFRFPQSASALFFQHQS
jgi:hypothetical protein